MKNLKYINMMRKVGQGPQTLSLAEGAIIWNVTARGGIYKRGSSPVPFSIQIS